MIPLADLTLVGLVGTSPQLLENFVSEKFCKEKGWALVGVVHIIEQHPNSGLFESFRRELDRNLSSIVQPILTNDVADMGVHRALGDVQL